MTDFPSFRAGRKGGAAAAAHVELAIVDGVPAVNLLLLLAQLGHLVEGLGEGPVGVAGGRGRGGARAAVGAGREAKARLRLAEAGGQARGDAGLCELLVLRGAGRRRRRAREGVAR